MSFPTGFQRHCSRHFFRSCIVGEPTRNVNQVENLVIAAKVYVVDQDTANVSRTKLLLEAHHFEVKCFTSAEAFIAQHHPTQVGCILVDLALPDLGSTFLIGHLLDLKSILSVIVLTAVPEPQSAPEFASSSVGLLRKPYSAPDLIQTVEKAVAASIRRRMERRG